MEALVKTQMGKGFVEIREVAKPSPEANEVLIRIKATGICGSDIHFYDGTLTSCIPPVILGHEFSGEIVEVGNEVSHFRVGDRVVAEAHKGGCGICPYCLTGRVEVCRNKKAAGYRIDGCFAPFIALPEFSLHSIPDNVSFEQAALTEPLAIVAKGVLEKTRIEPEDFVVVLGCGPIGLLAAAAAKAAGAREVVITGTSRDEHIRLAVAKKMGFHHAVNVEASDITETVLALTHGLGTDVVVDASGAEQAINQAFDFMRVEGRMCALGHTGRDRLTVQWEKGLMKSIRLVWSHSSNWTAWERAVSLLETGKIDVDPLITCRFPLKDWKKAFGLLEELEAVKILLIPEE